MNEIVKSQIRFLEIKLATATDERKKELEEKIKVLKANAQDEIVPIFKENVEVKVEPPTTIGDDKIAAIRAARAANILKKQEIPEIDLELETKKVEAEVVKLEVVEPLQELSGGTLVLSEKDATIFFEGIEEAEKTEELPTVDEVEKEIEELPEIVEEEEKGDDGVDVIGEDVPNDPPTPVEEKEETPIVPQPGEVEFEEKESESKQVEEPIIGGDEPSNEAEVEDIVEEPVIEVPLVAPPVVTETTTKKVVKRGRPKGTKNRKRKVQVKK